MNKKLRGLMGSAPAKEDKLKGKTASDKGPTKTGKQDKKKTPSKY